MPADFSWAVDDLVHLLKSADIGKILADFGHQTGQNDPIVHFYETFLAEYDPRLREKRGVYYTPEPVVRYIVRSVDSLLKTHFNKPKGLADEKTLILDPATGTATFLYFVIEQIRESMKGQEGRWPGYVRQHLLKRIFGFELLMAPYAVAHLKLGLQLEETGYTFGEDERLGIYLTNTLEDTAKKSERLVAKAISDEADAASDIKREKPILVVLGNPPYSGHSANRSRNVDGDLTFIGGLIEDYKKVDGAALGGAAACNRPRSRSGRICQFIRRRTTPRCRLGRLERTLGGGAGLFPRQRLSRQPISRHGGRCTLRPLPSETGRRRATAPRKF